ncbi:MAG: hypothetical protein LUE64_00450, partial [Candidatus Gastranaerophilales bacterium]|nr:hypothetical protein [Candidatus Gastranaerophilales bacterium]
MYIAGVFLTGLISYFISAIFNRAAYFLIIFFAAIIFNVELLSLFKGIDGLNILFLTAVEAFIAFVIWFINKRPVLKISFPLTEFKKIIIEDKTLALLAAVWLIFIITAFICALFSPVTEPDAQSYHALRVLYWLREGFIYHFETSDVRNICLPVNSELFYTWTMALFKSDAAFGLLQFFSYFQLIFFSFKIMENFQIDFTKRIWAILIFSSLPCVIIETSSTQTDLLTGALLAGAIYFILEYKKQKAFNLLFFAALSTGISFGVKTTSFMVSIPLLIWFVFILKRDFIKYFALLFLNSIIFSS